MNKMQMAHDFAMIAIGLTKGTGTDHAGGLMDWIVSESWKYADAMQAEADKRITEVRIDGVSEEHADALRKACGEEWKPDWSQAPEWATTYTHDRFGGQWWDIAPSKGIDLWLSDPKVPYKCENAPSFNYQGNWQDSLRKRPK